jgi:hypothetical protein
MYFNHFLERKYSTCSFHSILFLKFKTATMKTIRFLTFLLFFSISYKYLSGQNETDTSLVRIETRDGNEYSGRITGEDSVKIILQTQILGEISIPRSEIRTLKKIQSTQVKEGQIWFPNPQASRYFWAPNGYGLKKGEGYYQNIWVLWNQFAYGITDNISIGGAMIPLFLFDGAPTPVFISPKVSIPIEKEKINMGGGVIAGTILGEEGTTFGIVYGVSTFGTPDNNITFGVGYGFAGGEWAPSPLINFCGMFRLSPRWYFISENYYIGIGEEINGGMISGGARWIIKKAAVDFGLFFPVGSEIGFVGIPWLGFTIPFGNTD